MPGRFESHRPRSIAVFTYNGGQSLDAVGPLEVFSTANRLIVRDGGERPYQLQVIAPQAGPVTMSSGLTMLADRGCAGTRGGIDTLVVAGGSIEQIFDDRTVERWLRAIAPRTRRIASVCTGAFLLARAGLLDHRRVTTHWSAAARLAQLFPHVEVDADAIFIRAGNVYTSAGVTAGIDLALALVEEDLGHRTALAVARQLVVFLKRPGGQSQFSSHLEAQRRVPGALGDLPEWILAHLGEDLGIDQLAARAAMSPRNFARVFQRALGTTPAKFVERARIDAARRYLEDAGLGLEDVARRAGFRSAEQMRRTFHRHLRVMPHDYRRRFPPRGALAASRTN
ncbi:MAG TPA: GlxA family transcriptional regulator [Terriglobales bacterium]|nr:GlxA family transcriptional regulator [Terriglobales bacterium]